MAVVEATVSAAVAMLGESGSPAPGIAVVEAPVSAAAGMLSELSAPRVGQIHAGPEPAVTDM